MDQFIGLEDEEKCRVCRGPAEEGRPLRKPCRCAGSIGLIHQDCLQSWLNQRGTSSCELCRTQFRFTAVYADATPERLSPPEVLFGVSSRAVKAWLPFLFRLLFASFLWLVVTPLATTMLYHCWVSRPEAIFSRVADMKLLWNDLVAGGVLVACIIVSFLSLMSFADFLRGEWQRPRARPLQNNNVDVLPAAQEPAAVDNAVWDYAQQQILRRDELDFRSSSSEDGEMSWNSMDEDDSESSRSFLSGDEEDDIMDEDEEPMLHHQDANPRQNPPLNIPEDPADVDINIALDEVLGLRGPIPAIIRNLCWLLSFNAVYLGVFVFIPRSVGVTVCSVLSWNSSAANETTIPLLVRRFFAQNETIANSTDFTSISTVFATIERESAQHGSAFRLRDLAIVVVGYLTMSLAVVLLQFLWYISQRVGLLRSFQGLIGNEMNEFLIVGQRPQQQGEFVGQPPQQLGLDQVDGDNFAEVVPPGLAIGVALKAMVAIVKVGVLLFIKMFLLPVFLGFALDFSTMPLTGVSFEEQVAFTGRDLFSSILLHWVAGITFMLLVTVSVLQLREVAHPDLLAPAIRPQEPQPDLLGNLMNESVVTHTKRMALSSTIYAFLLMLSVYVPVVLLCKMVPDYVLGFFRVRFAFALSPQLQAPLELLVFHLSMLALLEYYKNSLGGLQHRWLKFISGCLGLRDRVLPQYVRCFSKIGNCPVFSDGEVDNFWYDLALARDRVDMVESNLHIFRSEGIYTSHGLTKPNGERVLHASSDYIRLPQRLPGTARRNRSVLLPTTIGRYRLKQHRHGSRFNIELWEEVTGPPMPRPPEGWDDLAPLGGAEEQGRWAWGQEKMSRIERSVAVRRPFFCKTQSAADSLVIGIKLALLILLSWCFATMVLFLAAVAPLAVGRLFFALLHVPEKRHHDPFAFFIGFVLLNPLVRKAALLATQSDEPWTSRIRRWLRRFTFPPRSKAFIFAISMIFWFIFSPVIVGALYELAFVKSDEWFREPVKSSGLITMKSAMTGLALLYAWSGLACRGVLTREFRQYILDRPRAEPRDGRNRPRFGDWQGEEGRVNTFFQKLYNVLLDWDWDQVNKEVFWGNFARPIGQELFLVAAIVYGAMRLWLPIFGYFEAFHLRFSLGFYCVFSMGRLWRDQLMVWFERAHQAARDDRYLVGELLLNFGE